jgi:formylmethanofuran dehydrogenase subunit D
MAIPTALKDLKSLLGSPAKEMILITVRTVKQGESIDRKGSEDYYNSISSCEIDAEDFPELGIRDNDNIQISHNGKGIVVHARKSKNSPHRGMIFLPLGPLANYLIPAETMDGMPSFKGIKVKVKPVSLKPTTIEEVIGR